MKYTVNQCVIIFLAVVLAATTAANPAFGEDQSVYIDNIPFVEKKPDFGGETCIAMYLRSLGHDVSGDEVFDASGLDPTLGRGCHTKELIDAAKEIGFKPGEVWLPVRNEKALETIWKQILNGLAKKTPSVVCSAESGVEQFVLVIGFDAQTDKVVVHNPNVATGENEKHDRKTFLRSCCLTNVDANQPASFICLRLAGSRLKVRPETGFTDADFAQHIRKLKQRLPNEEFKIVLQKPFVVVGDGTLEQVQRSATGTVKWAVDAIKQDYFSKDPHHIIDVWLFKNPKSYNTHNLELFGTKPSTPYGYYSPTNRVLVMDISTGGGTLVHEIVHPFMESNFEACPSWFNEGLASLYEQSSSRNGHIIGLTNWRLRGLQLTIQDGRLPSFKKLCSTSTREFYDGDSTNYAQARYLCYYLQEKDLLIKYFHGFRANADKDPSGYETLQKILKADDMVEFQKRWENYVMKLRFGN